MLETHSSRFFFSEILTDLPTWGSKIPGDEYPVNTKDPDFLEDGLTGLCCPAAMTCVQNALAVWVMIWVFNHKHYMVNDIYIYI
jgi:hypothetical protein